MLPFFIHADKTAQLSHLRQRGAIPDCRSEPLVPEGLASLSSIVLEGNEIAG